VLTIARPSYTTPTRQQNHEAVQSATDTLLLFVLPTTASATPFISYHLLLLLPPPPPPNTRHFQALYEIAVHQSLPLVGHHKKNCTSPAPNCVRVSLATTKASSNTGLVTVTVYTDLYCLLM
jgi:hypothetical protein